MKLEKHISATKFNIFGTMYPLNVICSALAILQHIVPRKEKKLAVFPPP